MGSLYGLKVSYSQNNEDSEILSAQQVGIFLVRWVVLIMSCWFGLHSGLRRKTPTLLIFGQRGSSYHTVLRVLLDVQRKCKVKIGLTIC